MARRAEDIFESMSELITTLAASLLKLKAGGLILIVMLLLGLTREAAKKLDVRPAGAGKITTGEKSTFELTKRLREVQTETTRINAEIAADEQLFKELTEKAEEVNKKTTAADGPVKK